MTTPPAGPKAKGLSGQQVDRRTAEIGLPSMVLAQAVLSVRRRIVRYIDASLFADPAFDLLLDLYVSELRGRSVSVSSACIAAAVPTTTALRWINKLRRVGLVRTESDPVDSRRVFVRLTDPGFDAIGRYLDDALSLLRPTAARCSGTSRSAL